MRDFRDAKTMAQALRKALATMGFKVSNSQSLELIAQAFGVPDWNTLSAAIRSEPTAVFETAPQRPPAAEGTDPPRASLNLLSDQLESTLKLAFGYAKGRNHAAITLEHLVLFLLEDADALRVVKGCGVDPAEPRRKLSAHIETEFGTQTSDVGGKPEPTTEFQRVMQRAVYHVQTAGRAPVNSVNVLVAAFSEKESYAVKVLNDQGMTRLDAINFITHGIAKGGGASTDGPAPT